jgi:predicted transcriptional regulator
VPTQSVIERAFELAASGRCKSLTEVEYVLTREGFEVVHVHMRSPSLRKDLAALMNKNDDETVE